MNKLRKRTYKKGRMKRLIRESLVLSSTSSLSSRFVRFFESGPAESLLRSVNDVENFVHESVSAPLNENYNIRKNITLPMRNGIASFLSRNSFVKFLNNLRISFLNTSLRAIGIMLITFAVYATTVLLLKHYVSSIFGSGSIDDVFVIGISLLSGLLLTLFSEKSIVASFGTGKIFGPLLSECLGINDSALDKYPEKSSNNSVGVSFLLGAIFGILTMFSSPSRVLLIALMVIVSVTIINAPEFGLLMSVSTFSFLPVRSLVSLVGITFVSYFIKCVRLKRNCRFGTADVFMLLTVVLMLLGGAISGGTLSKGEWYVIVLSAVYFLTKNLLSSEKLVIQAFNAFGLGGCIAMAFYIISEYAFKIPSANLREAVFSITETVLDVDMLLFAVSMALPFVFSAFWGIASKRFAWVSVALAFLCALITDNFVFYVLLSVSVFLFFAFAHKAFAGALLGALMVMPPFLGIVSNFSKSALVKVGEKRLIDAMFGEEIFFANFFESFNTFYGVIAMVMFALLVMFSLQRVCGSLVLNSSLRNSHISGTVIASVIMMLVNMMLMNPLTDIRVTVMIWYVLGLCGSAYKVGRISQYINKEV